MKLSRKITLFFVSAILFSILIVSLISNSIINNRFDKYLVNEQEDKLEQISREINELYEENGYVLYERQISSYASLENLTIKVKGLKGNLLYSSDQMSRMGGMHGRMMQNYGMSEGEYVEKSFPLLRDKEKAGSVVIGYIDNSYLTEGALIFKNTLTRLLFLSAIVAIVIGIITSIFLANTLTRPLIEIRNTALEIQKGNLNKRSNLATNTIEISELSSSINYLGETLSKQENIRKKYASDISHELRTPISTLKSHIEAIMDGVWQASPQHLSILLSEINRLSGLVDDLKDSFNSDENGVVLNKTKFNLSKDIEDIMITFNPLFSKDNIIIRQSIEENIIVFMDRDKFKQVIYNLMANSIKYVEDKGEIYISLKTDKNNAIIRLRDNGLGIKEEHLPFIFDRFYRVDKSRNIDTGGSGLGLAIVKSIVEAHDGRVDIKSKYKEGTEFTIILPLGENDKRIG